MRLRIPRFVKRFLRIYTRVHVPFFAAALAYYALFSLLPLLLFLAGLFGIALRRSPALLADFEAQLVAFTRAALPASTDLAQEVLGLLTQGAPSFTLGAFVLLAWLASHFFAALSYALSVIFGGRTPGVRGRLVGLFAPLALGMGLLLLILLNLGLGFAQRFLPQGALQAVARGVVPYASTAGAFFFIYRFLPRRPPPTVPALVAALGVALAWEGLRRGLPLLIPRSQYEVLYGPLAGLVLALLGFYLAMLLLLAGAVLLRSLLPDQAQPLEG